jgi:para-aminobenzoate synthetase component II
MGPRVVVIDNYDSFTYNLVQALGELGCDLVVRRNDAVDVAAVTSLAPDAIVLSPGPGRPEDAGVTSHVVEALSATVPILGVCLGHQAICQAFGAAIAAAPEIVHGKPSDVRHVGTGIYEDIPDPFSAARYHSLVVDASTLPDVLEVTAWTGDVVMGVRHRDLAVEGVQFHPESVLTADGPRLLANFVDAVTTGSRSRQ